MDLRCVLRCAYAIVHLSSPSPHQDNWRRDRVLKIQNRLAHIAWGFKKGTMSTNGLESSV